MWQTIGQDRTLALLEYSIKNNELAHAYLIVGPPHIGKMTLATDFAQAINCQGSEPPCKECHACKKIASRKHADVIIIDSPEDDSQGSRTRVEIGIDQIRELQRNAALPPYEGKYKVFIINGAESLSQEAANCLLKTLEEPPPHVIIILLTANESLVLPTIASRCQRLELRPLSHSDICKILTSTYEVDSKKANLLAGLAQGCLGWAINAVLDNSALTQRTQFLDEMLTLLEEAWDERMAYAAKLGDSRMLVEETLKTWATFWRDIMLIKNGCKEAVINSDYLAKLETVAQKATLAEVRDFISVLTRSLGYIASNANLRLAMEVVLLNMPRTER
jgi:DNA polymerase-3 subunit delta'